MHSAVLWRGPSRVDGAPVVAVATGLDGSSENRKTGPMVQTWIVRSRVHPVIARRDGRDRSVCGDCAFRDGGCYVNLGQAPAGVYDWAIGQPVVGGECEGVYVRCGTRWQILGYSIPESDYAESALIDEAWEEASMSAKPAKGDA